MTSNLQNRQYEISAPGAGTVTAKPLGSPGPGQALIRVIQNGLCTSEMLDWSLGTGAPRAIGHEPVGEVVAVGEGARVRVGDIITGRIEASFSDFVIGGEDAMVVVPEGMNPLTVLGEPVGCVVEAARRSRIQPGQSVALIGAGYMGLLMTQVLTATEGVTVTAIDTRQDALDHARSSGARHGVLSSHLTSALDDSFDLVVEASGSQAGLDLATALVRLHGTVSILGFHQGMRQIDATMWNYKSIDVVNAHVRDMGLLAESTALGLEMQRDGRIDPASLITHRFGLSQVDEAFETLRAKPAGFIKAVIELD